MKTDLYQLVKDKNRIEMILDFLPYPFLISEFRFGTFRNIYLNKRFVDEIGYTVEEIPTIEEWFEAAYPDEAYRKEVIAGWTRSKEDAKRNDQDSALLQVLIRTKHDGDKWYEVNASFAGSVNLVAFVCLDEARARERELTRLVENKNRTLSILAHDVRVPIANLRSLTSLLLTDNLNAEEFRDRVTQINARSSQLLEFIDTTLYWTKANFDNLNIRIEPVDTKEVITNVLSLNETSANAKNIIVEGDFQTEIISTDREIFTIFLRNIISNAIKFTPEGGRIKIAQSRRHGKYSVRVTDSGIGMTKDMLDKIEQDNYTSTHGTNSEKGLGIGLKLCRQLAKKIHATIQMESEKGKGTSVEISLPQ